MSTRTSDRPRAGLAAAGALVLGLAAVAFACSQGGNGGDPDPGATASATAIVAPGDGTVACAVNGALNYADDCTAEHVVVDGSPVLVIRHADGGFRRFDVLAGGTLAEADGALRATVLRNGTTLEVTIGSDRYRLDAGLGNVP